jgi:hypothetical protein
MKIGLIVRFCPYKKSKKMVFGGVVAVVFMEPSVYNRSNSGSKFSSVASQ